MDKIGESRRENWNEGSLRSSLPFATSHTEVFAFHGWVFHVLVSPVLTKISNFPVFRSRLFQVFQLVLQTKESKPFERRSIGVKYIIRLGFSKSYPDLFAFLGT